MQVELVNVQTSDGVRLDGALARPGGPPRLGLDLVILHHGVGGAFYRPGMAAAMTERFVEQGCSVLRVNNRGHDIAYTSPKGDLGAAFEIVDEFRLDSRAWLDFAENAGFRRVGLWGHSLGAVKVIYTLAVEEDSRVVCAIASSPPRLNYESFVTAEDGESRAASIARANELVATDESDELVRFDLDLSASGPSRFSARSLVDKYGPDDRYDLFRHVPNVRVPLLLMVGGSEGGFRFEALVKQGPALAAVQPNLTFALLDGADHSYMSRIPEVWSLARSWLESVPTPIT